jgi:hypothetical protein
MMGQFSAPIDNHWFGSQPRCRAARLRKDTVRDRYIRRWLARHRELPAELLITTLVAALETARAQGHGPALPELQTTMPVTIQNVP